MTGQCNLKCLVVGNLKSHMSRCCTEEDELQNRRLWTHDLERDTLKQKYPFSEYICENFRNRAKLGYNYFWFWMIAVRCCCYQPVCFRGLHLVRWLEGCLEQHLHAKVECLDSSLDSVPNSSIQFMRTWKRTVMTPAFLPLTWESCTKLQVLASGWLSSDCCRWSSREPEDSISSLPTDSFKYT